MLVICLAFALARFRCAQDKPEETLSAVVAVSAKIQPDARSAATLGAQRRGSGALIREGYVLTIGYLVIEAEAIEVTGADGRTVPATLAGYDHATGFGLLKLRRRRSPASRCRSATRPRSPSASRRWWRPRRRATASSLVLRRVAPAVLGQLGIPARLGDLHLPAGDGLVGRAADRRARASCSASAR